MTISPSCLDRISRCPGSSRMEDKCPPSTSAEAERGIRLHEIMKRALTTDTPPHTGQAEDDAALDFCFDWLTDNIDPSDATAIFISEHCLDLSFLGIPKVEGRCRVDYAVVWPGELAILVDLKFGGGMVRPPSSNPQMATYALGIREMYGVQRVMAVILQPSHGEPMEHTYTAADLDEWQEKIITIVSDAKEQDAPLYPGDHCVFCRARELCPACQDTMTEAITTIPVDEPLTIAEKFTALSPSERGRFYNNLVTAFAWAKVCKEACDKFGLEGGEIGGWEIGEGRRTRVWADETRAINELSNFKDTEELIEKTFVSPAKAEKMLGKAKKGIIDSLTKWVPGKPAMVKA